MKPNFACLSLAAFVFASCDKNETKPKPDDTASKKPRMENRANAPTIAEKLAPARHDSPAAYTSKTIDRPLSHPVDATMIRPVHTAPDDASWETLTAEQRIEKFTSSGIDRVPEDISDKILSDATSAGSPEDQLKLIIQQAAAWHHINELEEDPAGIPNHMKMALLESLSRKHGESWMDMVTELDEQVAASNKVNKLRAQGIPGMSPDESQDFIIIALGKYGPDYKAILSVIDQSTRK